MPCVHKLYGTDVSINSACFGYFRSIEIFLKRITDVMLDQHNKQLFKNQNSLNEKNPPKNFATKDCSFDSPKTNEGQTDEKAEEINDEINSKKIEQKNIKKFNKTKIKNPFKEQDYLCDSTSDIECQVLNGINTKKMHIMNCYLRFMRLAHIGNGLDIYWRKIIDIDIDISYDQYYEMIEYKTSEILVFMIDCLCILHDVGFYLIFFWRNYF